MITERYLIERIDEYLNHKLREFSEIELKLRNRENSSLDEIIYKLLVYDYESIATSSRDLSKYSSKIYEVYLQIDDLFKTFSYNYPFKSNEFWHSFGHDDHRKFTTNKIKLDFRDCSLKYSNPTIGFKYYLKVDLDLLLRNPKEVASFYHDLLKDSYFNQEIYKFKVPRKFNDFLFRRDSFVMYLKNDLNSIKHFLNRVNKKVTIYDMTSYRGSLGFDVSLNTKNKLSYNQIISQILSKCAYRGTYSSIRDLLNDGKFLFDSLGLIVYNKLFSKNKV